MKKLLEICLNNDRGWDTFNYTEEHQNRVVDIINKQINKHKNYEFVKKYYIKRLAEIKKIFNCDFS